MLKDKIKKVFGKKSGNYNQTKDETSNSGGSSNKKSFWEKLIETLYPMGGGR